MSVLINPAPCLAWLSAPLQAALWLLWVQYYSHLICSEGLSNYSYSSNQVLVRLLSPKPVLLPLVLFVPCLFCLGFSVLCNCISLSLMRLRKSEWGREEVPNAEEASGTWPALLLLLFTVFFLE